MEKYEFIEITEYEEIYDECVVYDLTIENSHSYTANGFVVHNCGCLSSSNTGIHMPMATLIDETVKVKKSLENKLLNGEFKKLPKIVADGGIRNYSDAIKSLALGSDYVMIGSVFAKMFESAAPKMCNSDEFLSLPMEVTVNDITDVRRELNAWYGKYNGKKIFLGDISLNFYGMASREGQIALNGVKTKTSEGLSKRIMVEYTMKGWVDNFTDYLRSAMSYLGVKNLEDLRNKSNLIVNSENAINAVNK